MLITGLANRLFRNRQSGDYLYVYRVEGDRVLGVVVDREGLPPGKRIKPARVWLYLGEFAKAWEETALSRLAGLLEEVADLGNRGGLLDFFGDLGDRAVVVDLRHCSPEDPCPLHRAQDKTPNADKPN